MKCWDFQPENWFECSFKTLKNNSDIITDRKARCIVKRKLDKLTYNEKTKSMNSLSMKIVIKPYKLITFKINSVKIKSLQKNNFSFPLCLPFWQNTLRQREQNKLVAQTKLHISFNLHMRNVIRKKFQLFFLPQLLFIMLICMLNAFIHSADTSVKIKICAKWYSGEEFFFCCFAGKKINCRS